MEHARRNAVGATIRKLRVARSLTQEALAAQTGVAGFEIPRGTLAKIEAGIRGISDLELFVVARVLKVSVDALYPAGLAAQMKAGRFSKPQ